MDINISVGMPAALYLNEFGSQIWSAFGQPAYLVGSSMYTKQWRDIDVRLILPDEEYAALELGDPKDPHRNAKWVALVMAFSALGKQMTGLPIDFQIQQRSWANETYDGPRNALGITELRMEPKATTILRDNYEQLIFAVEKKFPNESRHETALRYILEAERSSNGNTPVSET